jgi:hypothetical protein
MQKFLKFSYRAVCSFYRSGSTGLVPELLLEMVREPLYLGVFKRNSTGITPDGSTGATTRSSTPRRILARMVVCRGGLFKGA